MLDRLQNAVQDVTIATTVADSEEILFGPYAAATVFIPSGSSITVLNWYAASKKGGTYMLAHDWQQVVASQTVEASKCYMIPVCLFGAPAIKAVGDAAGTVAISMKG